MIKKALPVHFDVGYRDIEDIDLHDDESTLDIFYDEHQWIIVDSDDYAMLVTETRDDVEQYVDQWRKIRRPNRRKDEKKFFAKFPNWDDLI